MSLLSGLSRWSGGSAARVARRLMVVACGLALAVLWLVPASASAAQIHVFSSFGSAGSGAGEVSEPQAVAVDDATGDVYVADTGNHRVDEFSSSGTFIQAWGWGVADGASSFETCTTTCQDGISGSGAGQFESPTFIAVDNSSGASAGDVYVGDTGDNLVTKFTASGSVVSSWGDATPADGQLSGSTATGGPFTSIAGIAVDGSGNLNVYDPNSEDWFVFSQAGSAQPTISVGRGTDNTGIGVDSNGNLYKVVGAGNLEQYSPSGSDIGNVTDDKTGSEITGFAIDPATNDIYADDGGGLIRQYAGSSLSACAPAGNCQAADTFGSGNLSGTAAGVAVNSTNGSVYVADPGSNDVAAFALVTLPDVSTTNATNVGATGATLNGTANPDGTTLTGCRFEYIDAAGYDPSASDPYQGGGTVACTSTPSGSSPVAVSAAVSGLSTDTLYHYRLEVSNSDGASDGADSTFFPGGAQAGPAPTAGQPGLPDGRVYEQVSPVDKNGNTAGGSSEGTPEYTLASADGNSVLSVCELAFRICPLNFGTDASGFQPASGFYRSPDGWSAVGFVPPENQLVTETGDSSHMSNLVVSANFSQVAIGSDPSVGPAPENALDLLGSDGSVSWLSKPTITDATDHDDGAPLIIGASSRPDGSFGTIYFETSATLLPSDDQGNPAFGGASRSSLIASGKSSDFGFYEWTPAGGLSYAGVLPDGSVDPYGAVPAVLGTDTDLEGLQHPIEFIGNDVSSDGSRALFVSPGPSAGAPASDPPELYVRETAADGSQQTVLISRSAVTGAPAADSPLPVPVPGVVCGFGDCPYAYASPDGSRVFFEDTDALTSDAPNDGSVKEYEFDVDTNTLTYLPDVDDQQPQSGCGGVFIASAAGHACPAAILTSSSDGSTLLFVKQTPAGFSLDQWSGGQVTQIAQVPETSSNGGVAYTIPEARTNADGSVFVFQTDSPIYTTSPGEFNNAGGDQEVYRYVASSGQLSCLSCGPAGLAHTGDADMSNDGSNVDEDGIGLTDSRGISSDGDRVFFDSPDPLVAQASNGMRNVYEWEADGDGSCQSSADGGGCLFLISTGQSTDNDYFLDNSANGNDVFFATTQGLVPQDTDGSYDIYDARVDGGFPSPPAAAACSGDACQGPVAAAPALPAAATVSFAGPADHASPAAAKEKAKVTVGRVTHAGTRVTVAVKVPGKGRITVSGSDVDSAAETVGKAGMYRLTVSLKREPRALLKRKRSLKLTLRVRYVPAAGKSAAANVSMQLKAQG